MNPYLRSALRVVSRPLIRLASRAYVTGPGLSDAVLGCQKLAREGATSTIGYFNADDDAPTSVATAYLTAIDAIAAQGFDSYVSIKAPALHFDQTLVDKVVDKAAGTSTGIHFDSHWPEAADQTLDLAARSVQCFPRIGYTLPGRWLRSLSDADRMVDLGVRVRVVKGQWADPEHPERDLREGYLAVIDKLAGRARYVAVATHDPPLAREALRRLRDAGTACEMELLLGLPMRAATRVARECGVGVRVYIPFGESWLPYALSQVRKNPKILWWIMRDSVIGCSLTR
jgi:proline dehydrogenase